MRVSEEVLKCVVFIGLPRPSLDGRPRLRFIGTGFFVAVPSRKEDIMHNYLVTAKHIVDKLSNMPFLIRVNCKDGSSKIAKGEEVIWFTHPTDDSVDVALIPTAPSKKEFDYLSIPIEMFLSNSIMKQKKIGIGDEVFITGLFSEVTGSQRNLPIVRTGNIAMIPTETIPTQLGDIEAYLIEARSIGGLSGSPVFVREPAPVGLGKLYLLGLACGHWDIPFENNKDFLIDEEVIEKVNMGIAVVIPAKMILEVINHPDLVKQRNKLDKELSSRSQD